MEKTSKIYIAGHLGLVGSAIQRRLESEGYTNLILRSRSEFDLLDQSAVRDFFSKERPEYVFLAAAKVGGIMANTTYPAEFIYENIAVQTNAIHYSYISKVKKLLFLGSSCIYPKNCPQPINEEYIMTGPLEPTNSPYAIAKIAGIEMCWAYNRQYGTEFIPVMPTNLFGPNDNFDLETSHVLPALIRKFYEAKQNNEKAVTVWGTGNPRREFLHVDDLADACVFIMNKNFTKEEYKSSLNFNIGSGTDISIKELAELIKEITGFKGKIIFDSSKPDGMMHKRLNIAKIAALNWKAAIALKNGLANTYRWYLDNRDLKKKLK